MNLNLILLALFVSCTAAPSKQMTASKNFNGKIFQYKNERIDKSIFDVLKWKLTGTSVDWPKDIPTKQVQVNDERADKTTNITFINHSTFLIQNKNINILTDPIWGERTSPISFIGPKRVRKPAVKFVDLPPIDVVLIGHNHYDHLDIQTLIRLHKKFSPTFIVGLGVERLLKANGITKIVSLDWEESFESAGIKYTFVACKHWSARGLFDRNTSLWGSFIIKGSKQIYFASDTGYSDHFKDQFKRYGKMDISLIPIGAYEPRWFMKDQHMNPRESVKAHIDLQSDLTIGMHFGTFKLTDEGINKPVEDLQRALVEFKIETNKFIAPEFGQQFRIEE